ncbi:MULTISPECIES: restriction endonuclease subunit S [unclassified Polaribacter]|uniref:restriction endonuclease subunit S n=1 Tax=unclassified Polaribacter TaxID=196858 RepID=UPI0011BE9EBA|nr:MULTISPECIES: restriction endonuclease subunit S [unclassified Polaribacter]TXD50497.1 restriction endonuclease subunit S [Polaribacter sp. IC063]TXD61039.1 restriction endonuclease subunit S [Polaribacter sp. IC066]
MNLEKKEGYKETKLGWIPEDWNTPTIIEVFDFLRTTSFSRSQLNYEEENEILYIHYGDIHATYKTPILDFDKVKTIPRLNNDVKLSSTVQYLQDGDVIIADASEDYEGIGTAIELQNVDKKKVISGLHTFALRDKEDLTLEGFRTYIFKNPIVKKALKTIATGSKVFGISKGNVQKFEIVLPTLPEQQKIANILNTWDKAIVAQEKLIAQKQALKKGLMQQLLTGKKRFAGFEEEWEVKFISEITSKIGDGLHSTPNYDEKGTYYFINGNNLVENKIIITSNTKKVNHKEFLKHKKLINNRTILLSINGTIGNVAFYNKEPVILGKSAAYINILENVSKEYIAFQLQAENIKNHFKKVAIGSTIKNLGLKAIGKTKIAIPTNTEQEKIVEILKKSEDEIVSFQKHLESLKLQKQGLMQQLLTGEKRVKI